MRGSCPHRVEEITSNEYKICFSYVLTILIISIVIIMVSISLFAYMKYIVCSSSDTIVILCIQNKHVFMGTVVKNVKISST